MIGLTVAAKIVGLVGQVFLARLLNDADYGLAILAMTVPALTGILSQPGIKQVLIQRQKRFDQWQNPGFWMSGSFGLTGAVLTAALAPVTMWVYGADKALVSLMVVIALTMLMNALGTVAEARMQIDLRFRAAAVMNWASVTGALVLSVLMAWWGWGAMSLVFPNLVGVMVRTGVMWWITRPKVRPRLEVRRWMYMMKDTGVLLLTQLMWGVSSRVDAAMLGLFHNEKVVGQYGFAYNLSLQTVQLLTVNLSGVLFATFNKLQDEPKRQQAAFMRATRVLALVGVPACVVQAVVAEPAVYLMFSAKWEAAIPSLVLLSLGSTMGILSGPAIGQLQARAKYSTVLQMSAASAAVLAIASLLASQFGQATAVALAVGLTWLLTGVVWVRLGAGPGATWREVFGVFTTPMTLGWLAGVAGWAAIYPLGTSGAERVAACGLGVVVTGAVYLVLLRWVAREQFGELMTVAARMMPGRLRQRWMGSSGAG
jgi:O-antigen/teichoic acid export membrane protein